MIDCLHFSQSKTGRKKNRDEGFCRLMKKNCSQRRDCIACAQRDSLGAAWAKAMRKINIGGV